MQSCKGEGGFGKLKVPRTRPLASVRVSWLPRNCMQNRVGDLARHRRDRDPLTNKEDEVDSRGENEREEAKEKETQANRGYARQDCGDFAGATVWNHVATLHNTPVISDRHLTRRSCSLVRFKRARIPRNARGVASYFATRWTAANRFLYQISDGCYVRLRLTDTSR